MILLKEADWFRQSVYKLDYVLMEIDFLKSVQKHSVYDQIRINTLLNLLKSPMEYAVQALTHFKGKKTTSFIPHKQKHYTKDKYKQYVQKKFGWIDEPILNILNGLFEDDLYECFNDMHNNEKHSNINIQRKKIIENSGLGVYGNNIVINNVTIIRDEDSDNKGIVIDDKEIDITKNEGYTYEEELYFEYNNREVFSFLDEVYHMVNNFVLDIKEYIENRRDECGRY